MSIKIGQTAIYINTKPVFTAFSSFCLGLSPSWFTFSSACPCNIDALSLNAKSRVCFFFFILNGLCEFTGLRRKCRMYFARGLAKFFLGCIARTAKFRVQKGVAQHGQLQQGVRGQKGMESYLTSALFTRVKMLPTFSQYLLLRFPFWFFRQRPVVAEHVTSSNVGSLISPKARHT